MLPLLAGMGPLFTALEGCHPGAGSSQAAAAAADSSTAALQDGPLFFRISLAEWSFNRELFGGKMTNLDFPLRSKKEFGIEAVEYVNQFFMDKARDRNYLKELKQRCDDNGVTSVRIMCDEEGNLGDNNEARRKKAVENHYKWVEAAQFLGCTDIRVNARGEGTPEEVAAAAVKSLRTLSDFAKDYNIGVIVENHGEYSSNGKWIAGVMKEVDHPNCGLLPDWGNFCLKEGKPTANTPEAWAKVGCLEEYDRYQGVKEMMPYAKGVSAKSYAFNEAGEETTIDFKKMLQITRDAGFHGYVGIEFEGPQNGISEEEGIRRTYALLQKYGAAV